MNYYEAERRIEENLQTKSTTLNLKDLQLDRVPESISHLTHLSDLALSNNALTEFPTAICGLPKLKRLSLLRNNITQFPEDGGRLTSTLR